MTDEDWTPGGHEAGGLTPSQLLGGTAITLVVLMVVGVLVLLGVPNFLHGVEIARSYWGI